MEQLEHSGPGCWEGMGILPNAPSQLPGMAGDSPEKAGAREVSMSCPMGTGQLEAPTLELLLGKFNVTEPCARGQVMLRCLGPLRQANPEVQRQQPESCFSPTRCQETPLQRSDTAQHQFVQYQGETHLNRARRKYLKGNQEEQQELAIFQLKSARGLRVDRTGGSSRNSSFCRKPLTEKRATSAQKLLLFFSLAQLTGTSLPKETEGMEGPSPRRAAANHHSFSLAVQQLDTCCMAQYTIVSITREEKQGPVSVLSPESSHRYAGTAALSTPSPRAAFSPLHPPEPPQVDVSKSTPLTLEKGKETRGATPREDIFCFREQMCLIAPGGLAMYIG